MECVLVQIVQNMAGTALTAVITYLNYLFLVFIVFINFQAIKRNYTDTCSTSTDCDQTVGLLCQISAGACNCPTTSLVGMCDCPSMYYFSYTVGECGNYEEEIDYIKNFNKKLIKYLN